MTASPLRRCRSSDVFLLSISSIECIAEGGTCVSKYLQSPFSLKGTLGRSRPKTRSVCDTLWTNISKYL